MTFQDLCGKKIEQIEKKQPKLTPAKTALIAHIGAGRAEAKYSFRLEETTQRFLGAIRTIPRNLKLLDPKVLDGLTDIYTVRKVLREELLFLDDKPLAGIYSRRDAKMLTKMRKQDCRQDITIVNKAIEKAEKPLIDSLRPTLQLLEDYSMVDEITNSTPNVLRCRDYFRELITGASSRTADDVRFLVEEVLFDLSSWYSDAQKLEQQYLDYQGSEHLRAKACMSAELQAESFKTRHAYGRQHQRYYADRPAELLLSYAFLSANGASETLQANYADTVRRLDRPSLLREVNKLLSSEKDNLSAAEQAILSELKTQTRTKTLKGPRRAKKQSTPTRANQKHPAPQVKAETEAAEPVLPQIDFESIPEAVLAARSDFADTLILTDHALETAGEFAKTTRIKPREIYSALASMATVLQPLYAADKKSDVVRIFNSSTPFKLSISASQATKARFLDSRTVSHEGVDYQCLPHLKKGSVPGRLFRIHFSLVPDDKRLLVGVITEHLRITGTKHSGKKA